MAEAIDLNNLAELRGFLGEISDDDCRILIEEFGETGSTGADLAQTVYEELEATQFKSVADLVWHLRKNPCFISRKQLEALPGDKTGTNGDSWNLARSKSSNANKYTGGFAMVAQQQSASTTSQMEDRQAFQAMPYSGTSNPIQILRTPKGCDTSSLRLFLSKYLQDTEMRSILYDVYEKRNQNVLFLLRGASGSGKSTLASIIWAISEDGEICSADHYFINRNGQYKFNRESLGDAHQSCQTRCRAALARGDGPIIIDNTNTLAKDMMPYVEMAIEFNYDVKMIEPKTDWKRKVGLLFQKNIHGVPRRSIEHQLEKFEMTTVNGMIDKALRKRNMDKRNYRVNQDLNWGTSYLVSSSTPIGTWSPPVKAALPPQTCTLTPLTPTKLPSSPTKTPGSPSKPKQMQLSWKEPLPVAPNSPMRLSDFVPDLNNTNGNGQKSKKSGKKNGNGGTGPSTPTIQAAAATPFFEDPAHAAFEKLGRFFPTIPKMELTDIFNSYDGDLDCCALALLEKGVEMCDITDEISVPTVERSTDNSSEEKFEEFNWDVSSDIVGSPSNNDPTKVMPMIPHCSNAGGGVEDDALYGLTYEGDSDIETTEDDADMFEMVMPIEFARVLLRAFGHPEDETRSLNLDELTVKIGADSAFDIYKGLYINMHKTETGIGSAMSHSEESTRSNSPTSSSGNSSMDEEFDAIAISLSQMDLETTSRDPQLATIIDIESKIHQHKQESLRGYSAPYRTMAQNINFSMLKQEYWYLDAAIIDEVFSQCMLDLDRTKAALNEMYPHLSSSQQADQLYSSKNDSWSLKYNPKDVQLYSSDDLQSMQKTYEELEKEWSSKMTKIRDYHDKCKTMSNPQIKAHYITEAKKLSGEMKGLADEIQYYRAVKLNAKHKNDNILDLHGLKVSGAMRVLKEFLQYKEHEFVSSGTPKMIILIITGQGKHSKNGCPILQPAVRNFLSQKTYRFHSAKPGSYTVILTRGAVARLGVAMKP